MLLQRWNAYWVVGFILIITVDAARELIAEGRDIIEMTIGEPDVPTPSDLIEAAADASGGTLVGLHERGVIVALDAHCHQPPVTDVDDTGILTWPNDDTWRLGGEAAEVGARRLV